VMMGICERFAYFHCLGEDKMRLGILLNFYGDFFSYLLAPISGGFSAIACFWPTSAPIV
jgi:hypothetical protein